MPPWKKYSNRFEAPSLVVDGIQILEICLGERGLKLLGRARDQISAPFPQSSSSCSSSRRCVHCRNCNLARQKHHSSGLRTCLKAARGEQDGNLKSVRRCHTLGESGQRTSSPQPRKAHRRCFQVVHCSRNLYRFADSRLRRTALLARMESIVRSTFLAATASTKAKFFDDRSPL